MVARHRATWEPLPPDALGENLHPPFLGSTLKDRLSSEILVATIVKAPDCLYVRGWFQKAIVPRSYSPKGEGQNILVLLEILSDIENGELSHRSSPPHTFTKEIEGRFLQEGRYILQSARGEEKPWMPELELFLGIWAGSRPPTATHWLRWWEQDSELLLWSKERAKFLLNQLKELGIAPEQKRKFG